MYNDIQAHRLSLEWGFFRPTMTQILFANLLIGKLITNNACWDFKMDRYKKYYLRYEYELL